MTKNRNWNLEKSNNTSNLVNMVKKRHTRRQPQTHKLHTGHRVNNKRNEAERGRNIGNKNKQTTESKTKHHGSNRKQTNRLETAKHTPEIGGNRINTPKRNLHITRSKRQHKIMRDTTTNRIQTQQQNRKKHTRE